VYIIFFSLHGILGFLGESLSNCHHEILKFQTDHARVGCIIGQS